MPVESRPPKRNNASAEAEQCASPSAVSELDDPAPRGELIEPLDVLGSEVHRAWGRLVVYCYGPHGKAVLVSGAHVPAKSVC